LTKIAAHPTPILLFNDECAVCRDIGHWVQRSAQSGSDASSLQVEPIGDDPQRLLLLNPDLDIWDAYETIHLLMPDGSMRLGGEAVAEVLRDLPNTQWFARCFAVSVLGFRPFQFILNLAYAILADVRPLFGCESCGKPRTWLKPAAWASEFAKTLLGRNPRHPSTPHFSLLSTAIQRPATVSKTA
jgi:predicted DCC family thiol-disulfide oxidoreductase YuxK